MLGALGAGVVGTAAGGAWLFGGGDGGTGAADTPSVPDAAFEFTLRPRDVAVTYRGGDGLRTDNVFLRSDVLPGGELAWPRGSDADGGEPLEAGDTFIFDVEGAYDVSVVWATEETSAVLASRSGPVDPQDPTVGNVSRSQYDVQNTGFTQTAVPTPGAREHWRFEAGDRIESSPVVVDGVVYVGSNDGSVYAVDAATGVELWSLRTGFRVWAAPTVAPPSPSADGDREARSVFVGNTDGTLYALNVWDGSIRWETTVGEEFVSSPGVVSLADDGGPIESTVVFTGGSDGFTAFDAADGTELWSFETDGYISAPGILPPDGDSARDRTTVFAAGGDDTVYALDAHDGQEVWAASLEGVATPPTVARPFDAPLSGPGYTVFLGSGLAGSRGLSALDAGDGTLQWSVSTEADVVSSPAIVGEDEGMAEGGTIFAGDSGGGVYAVDAWTGDLRWTAEADDGITAAPIVADTSGTEWSSGRGNTLFLGSWDGNIYGFDTATGSGRWAFTTGASVGSSPTIVDGTLYVGNRDGHLYALSELQRDELGDGD